MARSAGGFYVRYYLRQGESLRMRPHENMKCSRCSRELQDGERFCLNCGEPTISATVEKIREKPSDIVTCLVVGLFFIFGVPALLFGGYLLAHGMGYLSSNGKPPANGTIAVAVACVPLGVFLALTIVLIRVGLGHRGKSE